MNIVDLLTQDGITARRAAGTNGGEYASPCPWCGGRDRFRIWPESGRYWCRQCGRKGDAIQYLRDKRGLSFQEAARLADKDMDQETGRREPRRPEPRKAAIPPEAWTEQAGRFVEDSRKRLPVAMPFLTGRGITEETAKVAKLGWNPADIYEQRLTWGLPEEHRDDGRPRQIWIPSGLVIPMIRDGRVVRLRIRRPEGEPRFVVVSGSFMGPMLWTTEMRLAVVVESELDGLLLHQETRGMMNVFALGSAQARPDDATARLLEEMDIILVALDFDEAGGKEAWQWWRGNYPEKVVRWPVPDGKDPGDYHQRGGSVQEWLSVGFDEVIECMERIAIQQE